MKIIYRFLGAIILIAALLGHVCSFPVSVLYWIFTGYEFLHNDYYDWVERKLELYDKKTGI